MGLTKEDLKQIGDLMDARLAGAPLNVKLRQIVREELVDTRNHIDLAEDRLYRKIKENAMSDVISEMREGFLEINRKLDAMSEGGSAGSR